MCSAVPPPDDLPVPTDPVGGAPLPSPEQRVATFASRMRAINDLYVDVVERLVTLTAGGDVERVEGLTPELFLGLACRQIGIDRYVLLRIADTLPSLPHIHTAFRTGLVSFGQVRHLTKLAAPMDTSQRAELDARVAATLEAWGDPLARDPQELLDAADHAARELHDLARLQRREQRAGGQDRLYAQPALDGGGYIVAHYGRAEDFATVLNAIDTAAGPPRPDTTDDDGEDDEALRPTLGRQRAKGLLRMAATYLSGGQTGRTARPLFLAHVDVETATAANGGSIELPIAGTMPSLTARILDALASDADLRVVLSDGKRPLATSEVRHASALRTKTRVAVRARDRGDRFPGSQQPAAFCDIHHLHPQALERDHLPENLVMLSRRTHRLLEHHGWKAHLDPDSGDLTIRRRHRRWVSSPRGTPLAPLPAGWKPPHASRQARAGPDPPDDLPF